MPSIPLGAVKEREVNCEKESKRREKEKLWDDSIPLGKCFHAMTLIKKQTGGEVFNDTALLFLSLPSPPSTILPFMATHTIMTTTAFSAATFINISFFLVYLFVYPSMQHTTKRFNVQA